MSVFTASDIADALEIVAQRQERRKSGDAYWRELIETDGVERALQLVYDRLIPQRFGTTDEGGSYQACTRDLVAEILRDLRERPR